MQPIFNWKTMLDYLNNRITFPNDCTPFDNAKKQISQATAKATTNSITRPSAFPIPLLICNTRRLYYKINHINRTSFKTLSLKIFFTR
jgi:hypothetical protein